jgi:CheY-like chemotaxis protein
LPLFEDKKGTVGTLEGVLGCRRLAETNLISRNTANLQVQTISQTRQLNEIDPQSQEGISQFESKRRMIAGIGFASTDVMIMVVEQEQCARASLSDLLSDQGHRVVQAADATEAIQRIEENAGLELILLDLEIPASARVLEHARRISPDVIVFGMSRLDALPQAVESVHRFFCKPLVFRELYREICSARMRAH